MGPVRSRFESEADYKFRCARYGLRWCGVFMVAAALSVPLVCARLLPPPVLIMLGTVLLFGLGISVLGTLGAVMRGWQAQRTPSALEQRVLRRCAVIIAVPFFFGVQLVLCDVLWTALATHQIRLYGRGRPGALYHLGTEPVQFVLTFGFTALVSLVLPVTIWLAWRKRLRSASGDLKARGQ